jgi:hypothetical protein
MKRTPLTRRTPLRRTASLTASPPRRTPLRARSAKTARLYRTERVPLVKALFEDGPSICPVPWCSNVADSPHEPLTRARGGSITDPANVVLVCWQHNQELTEEPEWGYDLGLLKHSWEKTT